jgi:hypothetical protein
MKPTPNLVHLLASAVLLVSAPLAALANEAKYSLGKQATFRCYGWLNISQQSVDDGVSTISNLVDVTNAASRFGFYIEPTNGGPLSFQFESSLGFRPSDKTSQTNTPETWNWTRKNLRQVQFIYSTGFGTFRLGQGSMPTDGVAEADLGETVVVAKSTIPESHGAFVFRTTGGALSAVTIGDAFNNFDGARRFRLRFDSVSRSGFSASAAFGREVLTSGIDDKYLDIALRYLKTVGDFDIKGAIGVSYVDAASFGRNASVGSLSVEHRPTGLNLSVSSGNGGGNGASYVYLKGGWTGNFLAVGDTKFILEGFRGGDYVTSQSNSHMWGVEVIQGFTRQNLEFYAGYRGFSYDDQTAISYRDIGAVLIGARWQF